jgi:hypothetical protein
MNKQIT